MPDEPTTAAPTPPESDPSPSPDPAGEKDWKAEAETLQREARKWQDRAKANTNASKELEQLRQASMSEQEKAVAAAKAEARKETLREVGGRMVASEFRAAATGRLSADQIDTFLDVTNLEAFLTDDGEVDAKKVAKVVDGIAPPAEGPSFPDLGQGARGDGNNAALNGDPLLRDLKSHLGIR